MNDIFISDRVIGPNHPPFIIAEMSGNHNQSLDKALEIVEAAAKSGAHGLKLQTYTADTMTIDVNKDDFFITDSESPWNGSSLYQLYQQAHTPWEWHRPILERCKEVGLIGFSTPFDITAVDFLESMDVPCYKIASFENTDLSLIKRVASTGKPIIISTGMASIAELDEIVRTARKFGCQDLVLLKCTSTYPASAEYSNLATIPHMQKLFNLNVGLSDHTLGIGVAIASVVLGATVIEKHFTIDRDEGGVDASFSMQPEEFSQLVHESQRAVQSIGEINYGPTESERKSMHYRRSLYITQNVNSGEELTSENLRAIRPGYGLPPKNLEFLLGKTVKQDIERGTPMSWDFLQ